jgi:hypothetical protein
VLFLQSPVTLFPFVKYRIVFKILVCAAKRKHSSNILANMILGNSRCLLWKSYETWKETLCAKYTFILIFKLVVQTVFTVI